jgi:protein involved in polysaccharide export with SLBB domain
MASVDSLTCVVGSDYGVNLGLLGLVYARGKTFRELKILVEKKVGEAYKYSNPSLIIRSTGSFQVEVAGEVPATVFVPAWALTRLSEVVTTAKTAYASLRSVKVIDASGNVTHYDLFKASRFGDLSQDPYVRPGDTIVLERYSRIVTIRGEVRRPERYELLDGESLKELIELYGGGFTESADSSQISVVYDFDKADSRGEMKILDFSKDSSFLPDNNCTVTVGSVKNLLPCVYFEGALIPKEGTSADKETSGLQGSQRLTYRFVSGETLSHAAQILKSQFSTVSDLANAYVMRGGQRMPVDLASFLYGNDYSKDIPLQSGDTIIVPFRQFFVSVSGAVAVPGRYPYVPDRSWSYYIGLAGGFNADTNSNEALKIVDVKGHTKTKADPIEPEDTLTAQSNSFYFYLGRVASIVSVVASALTAWIYVQSLIK